MAAAGVVTAAGPPSIWAEAAGTVPGLPAAAPRADGRLALPLACLLRRPVSKEEDVGGVPAGLSADRPRREGFGLSTAVAAATPCAEGVLSLRSLASGRNRLEW